MDHLSIKPLPVQETILITGSAGFIGTHLAEYYLKNKYNVIGLDNYLTGNPENTDYLSKKYPNSFFFAKLNVCHDWKSTLYHVSETLWIKKIKYVFFLSSPASVKSFQKYHEETLWANSTGLQNALIFADWFQARLIFASTSEIYGSPLSSPQKETDWGNVNPFGERSCYDESKRFGEALIYSWNKKNFANSSSPLSKFAVPHGIVRIFNTYGPRMHPEDDRVPNAFIKNALDGKDLVVHGQGVQTRSFCYIDDLVQGLNAYADSNLKQPVNIGNAHESRIIDLAQLVIRLTKSSSKIVFKDLPSDDPPQRKPDLALAREQLKYSPCINLESGLIKTIEWLKTKL